MIGNWRASFRSIEKFQLEKSKGQKRRILTFHIAKLHLLLKSIVNHKIFCHCSLIMIHVFPGTAFSSVNFTSNTYFNSTNNLYSRYVPQISQIDKTDLCSEQWSCNKRIRFASVAQWEMTLRRKWGIFSCICLGKVIKSPTCTFKSYCTAHDITQYSEESGGAKGLK